MKYKTLCCNAENFIERAKEAGLQVGMTPKPGAIMCWMKGSTLSGSDGAGHVAIVEKVYDNNHVYTSESGYGSSAFWNQHRYNNNGRWGCGSNYSFKGFIYNPAVKDEPAPAPKPSKSVDELAQEVIAGLWGNQPERQQRLEAAGYDYYAVQARVNEILAPAPTPAPTPSKSVDDLAREVIRGDWG